MNLRSSRIQVQDMGTAVYDMPEDYFHQRGDGQIPMITASSTAGATAGLQAFGWDGFYGSNGEALSDSGFPAMYPSPNSTTSDTASQPNGEDSPTSQTTGQPKRKRENRYKNAPPAVLSRRRAQNRASQRAYRERKEQRIRDLEILLDEAHRKQDNLSQAYMTLQAEYETLQTRPHAAAQPQASQPHAPMGMEFAHGAYGFNMTAAVSAADMMSGLYVPQSHPHHISEYPPPPR